jgi:biotin carboxyl carrier protein
MGKLLVTIVGHEFEVEVNGPPDGDGFTTVHVNGEPLRVAIATADEATAIEWAVVDTRPYELIFDRDMRSIETTHGHYELRVRDREAGVARPRSGDGRIKAPIPGLIARILVEPGQVVEAGQPVLVLEAMKMQNEIVAPRAGTVTTLSASPGQTVMLHELLAEIS